MSQLICPLCGKSSSLRRFDPRGFDNDIYAKNLRGLGRGRGFEEVDRHSLLSDHATMRMIGERALQIVALLASHSVLTKEDILRRLSITVVDERVVHQYRMRLNAARTTLRNLNQTHAACFTENEELRSRLAEQQGRTNLYFGLLQRMVNRVTSLETQLMVSNLLGFLALLRLLNEPSTLGWVHFDEQTQWFLTRLVPDPVTRFKVVLRGEDLPIVAGWAQDLPGLAEADKVLLVRHLDSPDSEVRRELDALDLRRAQT